MASIETPVATTSKEEMEDKKSFPFLEQEMTRWMFETVIKYSDEHREGEYSSSFVEIPKNFIQNVCQTLSPIVIKWIDDVRDKPSVFWAFDKVIRSKMMHGWLIYDFILFFHKYKNLKKRGAINSLHQGHNLLSMIRERRRTLLSELPQLWINTLRKLTGSHASTREDQAWTKDFIRELGPALLRNEFVSVEELDGFFEKDEIQSWLNSSVKSAMKRD